MRRFTLAALAVACFAVPAQAHHIKPGDYVRVYSERHARLGLQPMCARVDERSWGGRWLLNFGQYRFPYAEKWPGGFLYRLAAPGRACADLAETLGDR